jgi:hypothetical protein
METILHSKGLLVSKFFTAVEGGASVADPLWVKLKWFCLIASMTALLSLHKDFKPVSSSLLYVRGHTLLHHKQKMEATILLASWPELFVRCAKNLLY